MAIVEELKKIGGGTGSTIEEALATGDFGGGGGGGLMFTVDKTTGMTNKTYRELRDAFLEGQRVYFLDKSTDSNGSQYIFLDVYQVAEMDYGDGVTYTIRLCSHNGEGVIQATSEDDIAVFNWAD